MKVEPEKRGIGDTANARIFPLYCFVMKKVGHEA